MSGETEESVSGWTVDTLHSHVMRMLIEKDKRDEQRFEAQEKALTDALKAADRAVTKAEIAQEKRLDSVNEFREQQKDVIGTFMPRAEYDRAHTDLVERVEKLGQSLVEKIEAVERRGAEAREDLRSQVAALTVAVTTHEGRSSGIEDARVLLFAVLGIVVAAAAVIVAFIR